MVGVTVKDGIVTRVNQLQVGNYVTAQTEIATIDDRSEILVDFWVPERFATAIEIGAPRTATRPLTEDGGATYHKIYRRIRARTPQVTVAPREAREPA